MLDNRWLNPQYFIHASTEIRILSPRFSLVRYALAQANSDINAIASLSYGIVRTADPERRFLVPAIIRRRK